MDAVTPRPALVCRHLLQALEASDGRRRKRKRDTRPDAIGLAIKRALLEEAVAEDPAPEAFEGWLLERCLNPPAGASSGSIRAMARDVLAEWRLALAFGDFRAWLDAGAHSDDAQEG